MTAVLLKIKACIPKCPKEEGMKCLQLEFLSQAGSSSAANYRRSLKRLVRIRKSFFVSRYFLSHTQTFNNLRHISMNVKENTHEFTTVRLRDIQEYKKTTMTAPLPRLLCKAADIPIQK